MAKVGQIQAKAIYEQLKDTIDTCIKNNEWEFYKHKTLGIAKWIKDLKNYLENCIFPGPRDEKWASDLEYFEKVLQRIHYHASHTEDLILRNTHDNKDIVKL